MRSTLSSPPPSPPSLPSPQFALLSDRILAPLPGLSPTEPIFASPAALPPTPGLAPSPTSSDFAQVHARRPYLTDLERKGIVVYRMRHPDASQYKIAALFNTGQPTISHILKYRDKWLQIPGEPTIPNPPPGLDSPCLSNSSARRASSSTSAQSGDSGDDENGVTARTRRRSASDAEFDGRGAPLACQKRHRSTASFTSTLMIGAPPNLSPRPLRPGRSSTSSAAGRGTARFRAKPAFKRQPLTDYERYSICAFQIDNPTVRQKQIAALYGTTETTVSRLLKDKEKWLKLGRDEQAKLNIRWRTYLRPDDDAVRRHTTFPLELDRAPETGTSTLPSPPPLPVSQPPLPPMLPVPPPSASRPGFVLEPVPMERYPSGRGVEANYHYHSRPERSPVDQSPPSSYDSRPSSSSFGTSFSFSSPTSISTEPYPYPPLPAQSTSPHEHRYRLPPLGRPSVSTCSCCYDPTSTMLPRISAMRYVEAEDHRLPSLSPPSPPLRSLPDPASRLPIHYHHPDGPAHPDHTANADARKPDAELPVGFDEFIRLEAMEVARKLGYRSGEFEPTELWVANFRRRLGERLAGIDGGGGEGSVE